MLLIHYVPALPCQALILWRSLLAVASMDPWYRLSWRALQGVQEDPGDVRAAQGESELCGSRTRAILPLNIQLSPPFLCNILPPHIQILVCFWPNEFCWPHPDDSLRLCPTTKVLRTQADGGWPWCTLRLWLSGLRSSIGTKFESVSA